MRIASTGLPETTTASRVAETVPAESAAPASTASSSAPAAPLQSAVMEPALAALRQMPDIDMAKVTQLRDALARGEVPFDPAKLAGLITRFHGGRS